MMDNYKVILSEETIQKRVKELGEEITRDYQGKEPVVICMLKGAVYFFADLTKNIKLPLMLDFARLSSYRNGTTSGQMELIYDITAKIEGRDVILVEDIVDSGKTLAYFIELLKTRHPASVKICAFLDKKERREVDINVDYIGFDIPCGFVIGYGLDYAEKYREFPFLAEIINPSEL
ncbi:MAG: hypoxanthine phosphoribosyltransferase [Clostridia bacterium]|nr:hypoxanthine phosphoribosyltransferase [Clostridia bacterium]